MENDPNLRTDKNLLEKAGDTVKAAGKTIVEKTRDAAVATGTAAVAAGKAIAEKTKEGVEIAKDPHTREVVVEKSKEVSDKTRGIIYSIEETVEKTVDFMMGKTEDHSPTAQDLVDKASELIKGKTEEIADDLDGDDHNENNRKNEQQG